MGVFDGFAGAAVGALGGLLGASSANKESAASTQAQIDFQREMSNTAYQRAVADLNAAGLSPMLAYSQGGASAPQGASYKAENVGAAAVEGAAKGSQPSLLKAQTDAARSQEQLNIVTAKKVAEEAKLAAQRVLQEPARFYYEQAEAGSRINANSATAIKTDIDAANNAALRTPSSDPYWYRDFKEGGKKLFDRFLEKNKSFPWSLEGRRK
jgi:hypothetical protein